MATRPLEIGPTGLQTARTIRRLRRTLGVSQRQLATRLTALGHPIPHTAISRTERGQRRCDIDDLAAIAAALGVPPAALLRPFVIEIKTGITASAHRAAAPISTKDHD